MAPAPAQLVHDVAVVHNFMVHIDRAAVRLERQFDDIHRTNHAGAKAARPDANESLDPARCSLDLCKAQCRLQKLS